MLKKTIAAMSVATISAVGFFGGSTSAVAAADCSTPTLVNGSFEEYTLGTAPLASGPGISVIGDWMNDWGTPKQFVFLDLDVAPQALNGWETTNSDNYVELQRQVAGFEQTGTLTEPGYFDNYAVQPARGAVWGELNATEDAALFQDVALTAGTEYTWSVKHHGRVSDADATDEMAVFIGETAGVPMSLEQQTDLRKYDPINADLFTGAPLYSNDFTSATQLRGSLEDGWVMYRGTFTPQTSESFRFQFQALDGWDLSVGNMIDDIEFAPTECVSDPTADPNAKAELPNTGVSGVAVSGLTAVALLSIVAGVAVRLRRGRSNA